MTRDQELHIVTLRQIMVCTECGKFTEGLWEFGDEVYCQDCWEQICSDAWWDSCGGVLLGKISYSARSNVEALAQTPLGKEEE